MAGGFAAGVGLQLGGEPVVAGALPRGKLGGEPLGELRLGKGGVGVDAGNGFFTAGGIATGDAEDDAVLDGGMLQKEGFDFGGIELASGEVDGVAGATEKVDGVTMEFGQVGGDEFAVLEGRMVWQVGFGDRVASHLEAVVGGDGEMNVVGGVADEAGSGAGFGGGVIGNGTAFAAAEEVVNFESVLLEDVLLDLDGHRGAGGDGEVNGKLVEDAGAVPGAPHGGDSGESDGGVFARAGAEKGAGEDVGGDDDWMPVKEEREDEVGKAVAVGEGDDAEIGMGGIEPHGGADVFGIGRKLFSTEHDAARGAGAA